MRADLRFWDDSDVVHHSSEQRPETLCFIASIGRRNDGATVGSIVKAQIIAA
jgi:hypothetical protein